MSELDILYLRKTYAKIKLIKKAIRPKSIVKTHGPSNRPTPPVFGRNNELSISKVDTRWTSMKINETPTAIKAG